VVLPIVVCGLYANVLCGRERLFMVNSFPHSHDGEEEYLISSFEIGLARGGLKVALFWLAVFLALALVVCER